MAELGSIDAWVQEEINAFFTTPTTGQTKRYRAYCKITINGRDVTDRLDPYLMSVTVRNGSPWEFTIELDDRDGRLEIPPLQATVVIELGWQSEEIYRVFNGYVDDVQHGFGRRLGGRRMFIHGISIDQTTNVKTPYQDHVGEGAPPGKMQGDPVPFAQAMQQFAGNAGMTATVGPSFQSTIRDYWHMGNESIMQWTARHADEMGAWTRIEGTNIVYFAPTEQQAPTINCVWGDNLISWRVHPYAARPLWSGASQQFFDHVKGLWNQLQKQFNLPMPWGGSWSQAITKLPMPAPNSNVAQQQNDGDAEKASAMSGFGRIIINGEPQAAFGGRALMKGARPGVDGGYMIFCAVHTYSRQGFVTTLEVQPDVTAGSNNIGSQGYSGNGVAQQNLEETAQIIAQQTGQPQTINNPDGSVTTVYPNGMITIKTAIGTTTINPP